MKRNKISLLIICSCLTAVVLLQQGCYYDKADLVYPPSTGTCDTTGTTYANTIVPILTANCYSCHSGNASAGGGVVLSAYKSLVPYINNGHLMNDIMQVSGADAMPKGGAKIDNCSINKIAAWIKKGFPNN